MNIALRHWIATVSVEHAMIGQRLGFIQVCHGKAAPLRRLCCGDRVFSYSPKRSLGGNESLQAFARIGHLRDHRAYKVEMAPGFHPWRRDGNWLTARQAPIRPLLDALSFTRSKSNWGYKFSYGLFEISDADADLIAMAMGLPAL
ncbi:EVE domain-containing protein [Brucella pseudogrignonensis]|uniref:EVE domain-containing protein n=1 Tax=Brucella pseudogrignonensis TaxID=419475 RepID=UPI00124EE472|nr:EVE domain-containing protein [Brucella pseudogrignonensis]KAB2689163.1 EVE domain-containing protein [Brucella pseudogrignonensis]